jgi:hypothetical protein
MIVSDRHKFIFVHNPRCAGMSIRTALQSLDDSNNYFSGMSHIEEKERSLMHMPLEQLANFFPEVFEKFNSYYTFMMIRNPYTRAISGFCRTHDDTYLQYMETRRSTPLVELMNRYFERFEDEWITYYDYRYRHFFRQKDMAYVGKDQMIDSIYRFELLPDVLKWTTWMNVDVAAKLKNIKRLNFRPIPGHWSEILSVKAKDKIKELYWYDFETFDYSMDP